MQVGDDGPDGPPGTRVEVDASGHGERLDRHLAQRLGLSRARLRRLLARGRVELAGRRLAVADKAIPLRSGDVLTVAGPLVAADERPRPRPDLALRILDEGAGWLVVDKPAGRGVHPLAPEQDETVLNALVARRPVVVGVGEGGLRSGVVHRLDVGTSGVLAFATSEAGFERLRGAFRSHRVEKRYRVLVAGRLETGGRIELPLAVTRHRPARVSVVAPGSGPVCRQTVTPVRVLRDATLVEIGLETGFLHQIRATLAYLGHPVLGDPDYGHSAAASLRGPGGITLPRPMLHAARIALDEIDVQVAPPPDFEAVLAALAPASTGRDVGDPARAPREGPIGPGGA